MFNPKKTVGNEIIKKTTKEEMNGNGKLTKIDKRLKENLKNFN